MSDWGRAFIDALNSHDSSSVCALVTEDVRYHDIGVGTSVTGVRTFKSAYDEAETYSTDYTYTLVRDAVAGKCFAVEWVIEGTTSGKEGGLVTTDSGEKIGGGPAGTPYRLRGVSIGELAADGKIQEYSDYYNMAEYLRQIGS